MKHFFFFAQLEVAKNSISRLTATEHCSVYSDSKLKLCSDCSVTLMTALVSTLLWMVVCVKIARSHNAWAYDGVKQRARGVISWTLVLSGKTRL